MATTGRRHVHVNLAAQEWIADRSSELQYIARFHHSLSGFSATRLLPLPTLAKDLGVKQVLVKDETSRLDLPAFKILGASWATYRAIIERLQLPPDSSIEDVGTAARTHQVKLFAATDGNHGRAVARMAAMLGVESHIFVPEWLDEPTKQLIAKEGAKVNVDSGDYDQTILTAAARAKECGGLHIQDHAFGDYSHIAQVCVEYIHETPILTACSGLLTDITP